MDEHNGPSYPDGALAFANAWLTSNRAASGDQITAPNRSLIAKSEGKFAAGYQLYAGFGTVRCTC